MRKKYITVDVKDTVSTLIGKFKRAKTHAALVYKGDKYAGLVTKRFLLNTRLDPAKMKVGNVIAKRSKSKTPFYVPTLKPTSSLKEMSRLFASASTHLLPVVENDKVQGVVRIGDLLNVLANSFTGFVCDDLGSAKLETIHEDDDIGTAMTKFTKKGTSHLPVLDDKDRLIGMLSLSDLVDNAQFWGIASQSIPPNAKHQGGKRAGYETGEKTRMSRLPIKNFMSAAHLCCTGPRTKLSQAITQMIDQNVLSIVLVKYGKPVGILTSSDILRGYLR